MISWLANEAERVVQYMWFFNDSHFLLFFIYVFINECCYFSSLWYCSLAKLSSCHETATTTKRLIRLTQLTNIKLIVCIEATTSQRKNTLQLLFSFAFRNHI